MVATAGHPENYYFVLENRSHDRDVWQVTSTGSRVVGDQYVTGGELLHPANLLLNGLAHGTQMYRYMGCIGHQVAP